jgi:hypothetical protein
MDMLTKARTRIMGMRNITTMGTATTKAIMVIIMTAMTTTCVQPTCT